MADGEVESVRAARPLPLSEKALKSVADFMAGRNGVALKDATLVPQSSRVQFFKGKKFVNHLLENGGSKFGIEDREDALRVGKALLTNRVMLSNEETGREMYLVRVAIANAQRKQVAEAREGRDQFTEDGLYVWLYQTKGTQRLKNLLLFLILAGFVGACMFPIWPRWSKVALWYVSVTILGFFAIFTLVRYMIFITSWICGFDFWILPNIFADDLGFCDSFRPGYSFGRTEDGQLYWRLGVAVLLVAFGYWMYIQPTEFDDYVEGTKKFAEDLYSGNLLSDTSQAAKNNIDTVIPDIEDLMKGEDEEDGRVSDGLDDVELELDVDDLSEDKDPEDMSMLERLAYEEKKKEEAAAAAADAAEADAAPANAAEDTADAEEA